MKIIICRNCSHPLSGPLFEANLGSAHALAPAEWVRLSVPVHAGYMMSLDNVVLPRYAVGEAFPKPQSCYVFNEDDLIGDFDEHLDDTSGGCCGVDGQAGLNWACSCSALLGTLFNDCSVANMFVAAKSATLLRDAK